MSADGIFCLIPGALLMMGAIFVFLTSLDGGRQDDGEGCLYIFAAILFGGFLVALGLSFGR